jgi:hypothetical protein
VPIVPIKIPSVDGFIMFFSSIEPAQAPNLLEAAPTVGGTASGATSDAALEGDLDLKKHQKHPGKGINNNNSSNKNNSTNAYNIIIMIIILS